MGRSNLPSTSSRPRRGKGHEEEDREKKETRPLLPFTDEDVALGDRVKAVQRKGFLKRGRLELTPMFSATVNDAFYQKFGGGLRLAYNLQDSFAIAVRGAYYEPLRTDNVREGKVAFESQLLTSQLNGQAMVDGIWSPVYGKASFLGSSILHFDLFLAAGFGVIWSATSLEPRDEGPHLATDIGGGVRFYPKEWLAFELGLMATLYPDQPILSVPGTVQSVFVANVGLSFFFPALRVRPPMTARRAQTSVLALAVAALAAAAPRPALAQTRADAFAGKIPPVSGQLYRKAGRFELTATGNPSLNDAFYSKYFGGLKLGYHLSEAWSVSAHAALGPTAATGSAVVCPKDTGCVDAGDAMLLQVPGKLRRVIGAEIAWSPVYGKLNVLAEKVAHFDLSILGRGPHLARRGARVQCRDRARGEPGTTRRSSARSADTWVSGRAYSSRSGGPAARGQGLRLRWRSRASGRARTGRTRSSPSSASFFLPPQPSASVSPPMTRPTCLRLSPKGRLAVLVAALIAAPRRTPSSGSTSPRRSRNSRSRRRRGRRQRRSPPRSRLRSPPRRPPKPRRRPPRPSRRSRWSHSRASRPSSPPRGPRSPVRRSSPASSSRPSIRRRPRSRRSASPPPRSSSTRRRPRRRRWRSIRSCASRRSPRCTTRHATSARRRSCGWGSTTRPRRVR